jgi:DNA-binding CsgD family transcriptional regulator
MLPSSLPGTPSSLVGRQRELDVLREHLDAALAGRGGLVLIGGEAGIGKTALAETLCREADTRGVLVLTGRCYDLTQTPPYGPWIGVFGQCLRTERLPALPPAFAERGSIGPVASQASLFREVSDFFTAMAADRPFVLLLEDLHWADPASLDLVRDLAHNLAGQRILLVATYRADELNRLNPLHPLLPLLVWETGATRIDLRRLDSQDVQTMVETHYRLPGPDSARLGAYLDRRAGGNPLFLGELLRTLSEERVLRSDDTGDTLTDLSDVRIPPLLRQIIDGRLARLDDEVQWLLGVASVIGQDVPLDLWATVARRDEEMVFLAVEQATEAHLVVSSREGTRMQFAHALIREALYESILPMRRRVLHGKAGEALAAQANPDPDGVAYHFREAGDARAYDWLIQAGERAHNAYAYVVAGDRLEAALALSEIYGTPVGERAWLLWRLARLRRFSDSRQGVAYLDEAEALARQVGDQLLIGNVLLDKGMLLSDIGRIRLGLDDMEAGVATLQTLSAADHVRIQTLPLTLEVADDIVAEATLALFLVIAGRLIEARTRGEHTVHAMSAAALSESAQDTEAGDGYFGLARAYAALGLPEQARGAFAHARELYAAINHHQLLGDTLLTEFGQFLIPYNADRVSERRRIVAEAEEAYAKASSVAPEQQPRIARVPLLILEGDWTTARQMLDAMPRPLSLFPSWLRATIAAQQGDVGLGWQLVHEALPDGPETQPGDSDFAPSNALQRLAATLALTSDDRSTAGRWLEAYDRWLNWSGSVIGRSEGQLLWANYHRAAGDTMRAQEHAEQALAEATDPRQPLALLAAYRLLGEIAIDAGHYDDAARHLDESRRLAEACAAPYERALTHFATAALRAATGEVERSRALLDEARAICTPLEARPALARADALAALLDELPAVAPAYPAGLSAREVDVLRLVAEGRTNRDIADVLFLSEHTIRSHVRSILTKTRTDNRTGAALFAREHGLG